MAIWRWKAVFYYYRCYMPNGFFFLLHLPLHFEDYFMYHSQSETVRLESSPPNFILIWTSVSVFQVQLFQIRQRRPWESGETLTFLSSMCTLSLGKREKAWKQQTQSLCPLPAPMFNPWSSCWTHQKQSLVGRIWLSEVLAYISCRSSCPENIVFSLCIVYSCF